MEHPQDEFEVIENVKTTHEIIGRRCRDCGTPFEESDSNCPSCHGPAVVITKQVPNTDELGG